MSCGHWIEKLWRGFLMGLETGVEIPFSISVKYFSFLLKDVFDN